MTCFTCRIITGPSLVSCELCSVCAWSLVFVVCLVTWLAGSAENMCCSVDWCWPKLLLITNRKSYTGLWALAQISCYYAAWHCSMHAVRQRTLKSDAQLQKCNIFQWIMNYIYPCTRRWKQEAVQRNIYAVKKAYSSDIKKGSPLHTLCYVFKEFQTLKDDSIVVACLPDSTSFGT